MAHLPRRRSLLTGPPSGDRVNWRPGLLVVALLAACSAPPALSPSVEALASASARPSASAAEETASVPHAPSESAAASPDAPAGPVEVGGLAQTTVDRLRIREDPGLAAVSLGTLGEGRISYVVAGPVSADGFDWYLVSGLGLSPRTGCMTPINTDPFDCPVWFGWAAAQGPGGDPWLVAGAIDCPPWPRPLITDYFVYALSPRGYLACFGAEVRSVVGFYPQIPEDAGLGGACANVPSDLAWIGCNLGYERIVPDPATGFSGSLVLAIDPASGVELPARGQWIEVTGQYAHPAAEECTWADPPEASILSCRSQFVVESARAVSPP